MQCKGNIEIIDESKSELTSPCTRKNEDSTGLNGNVNIIDETKEKDEHNTKAQGSGNEACSSSDGPTVSESTLKENIENGEPTEQASGITDTREKDHKQDKDTNNNSKLSSEKENDRDDDDIIPHCNENNSLSFDRSGICGMKSYNKDTTNTLENELRTNSTTDNNNLSDGHKIEEISTEAKALISDAGAETTKREPISGSEHSSNMSFEKASDVYVDTCDFCKSSSEFMCEFCTFFYCKNCLERVHPAVGPYKFHKVIPVQPGTRLGHYDRCRDHGLIAQLFCCFCEVNRCTECVKTRCKLHFNGRVSVADIEKEKALLVEELEKATAKLGFLEKYKDNIQDQIDNIQLTGMLRREQIRQEFVSFHDLLIQKEAKMLQMLDQDVADREAHVMNKLQTSVSALEQEDARLTTVVTELVQSRDDAYFIEEYVDAKDLCHEIDNKVRDFNRDWAKNSTLPASPLLDNNFSMIDEKKQLSERLDATMELPQLKFKQSTLILEKEHLLLIISDYLEQPVPPTSTELTFNVELLMNGIVVYKKITGKIQDCTLNTKLTYKLIRGNRYLLKVTPIYTPVAGSVKCQGTAAWQGKPSHMLIVVTMFAPKLARPVQRVGRAMRRTDRK